MAIIPFFLLFIATPAHANAVGLDLFTPDTLAIFLLSAACVVLTEGFVVSRFISLGFLRVSGFMLAANIASLFAPLAITFFVDFSGLNSWAVHYTVTVFTEGIVLYGFSHLKSFPLTSLSRLTIAVIAANALTYAVIALLVSFFS